jgi:hypothetical protein
MQIARQLAEVLHCTALHCTALHKKLTKKCNIRP